MVGLLSENRRSLVYGLTDGMQLIADCFASLDRIEGFLLIEELNGNGKEDKKREETSGTENGGEEKEDEEKETPEQTFLKVRYFSGLLIRSLPESIIEICNVVLLNF